jgi:hypothetical protein
MGAPPPPGAPSGYHVAPGPKLNNVQPIRVGMCFLDFELPEERQAKEPDEDDDRADDEYLSGLRTKVLQEAYVLLVPQPFSVRGALYCRTNRTGDLLHITKADVDGGAIPEAKDANYQYLEAGQTYDGFWTCDKELFKKAIALIFANACSTFRDLGMFELQVRMAPVSSVDVGKLFPDSFAGRGGDKRKLAILLHNLTRRGTGYLSGATIRLANPVAGTPPESEYLRSPLADGPKFWVYARRPALSAMFFAEFIAHHATRVRADAAWIYDRFEAVEDARRAAELATRRADIDERLKADPCGVEYWKYAYDAATKGTSSERVEPKLFLSSLSVLVNDQSWKAAAVAVFNAVGAIHPAFLKDGLPVDDFADHWQLKMLTDGGRDAIHEYFDFYRYGIEQGDPLATRRWHNGYFAHIETAKEKIKAGMDEGTERSRDQLRRHADWPRMACDIGAHVPNVEDRGAYFGRYYDASEDVGYDWWSGLPEAEKMHDQLASDGTWAKDADKPKVAEIEAEIPSALLELKPLVDAAFIPAAKQSEFLERFFAWRSRTLTARIASDVERFSSMTRRLGNMSKWFDDTTFETIKIDDVRLDPRVNFQTQTGRIVVEIKGAIVAEIPIFVKRTKGQAYRAEVKIGRPSATGKSVDTSRPAGHAEDLHGAEAAEESVDWRGRPKNFRRLTGSEEKAMRVPRYLAPFAYSALIAYDICTLNEQLKERGAIEVFGRLGVNVALDMQSTVEALHFVLHHAARSEAFQTFAGKMLRQHIDAIGGFGRTMGRAAVIVEILLCMREGYILLWNKRESEAVMADEMGQGEVGSILRVKGWVLFGGAGAAGALIFVSILAGGVVVAAAGVVAAGLEVYAWSTSGDGSSMDGLDHKVVKAIASEFGASYAPTMGADRPITPDECCWTHKRLSSFLSAVRRVEQGLDSVETASWEAWQRRASAAQ